ncbi:unnamed protein product, partial [marine sediment metagenome]
SVPYASIGGFVFDTDTKMYYLIIALTLIAGLAALNLEYADNNSTDKSAIERLQSTKEHNRQSFS